MWSFFKATVETPNASEHPTEPAVVDRRMKVSHTIFPPVQPYWGETGKTRKVTVRENALYRHYMLENEETDFNSERDTRWVMYHWDVFVEKKKPTKKRVATKKTKGAK